MIDRGCARAGDRVPGLVAGTLTLGEANALERHLAECAACREEAEVVRALHGFRTAAPPDLAPRIVSSLLGEANRPPRKWDWRTGPRAALLAAATVAMMVAGAILLRQGPAGETGETAGDGEILPVASWPGADGLLAGAPVLADLSEEELELLLQELES